MRSGVALHLPKKLDSPGNPLTPSAGARAPKAGTVGFKGTMREPPVGGVLSPAQHRREREKDLTRGGIQHEGGVILARQALIEGQIANCQ
jgi:hypothetical protein